MLHDPKFHITFGSFIIILLLSFLFFINSGCEMSPTGGGGPSVGNGTIRGVVMDTVGISIDAVTVTIGSKTTNTDANGVFSINNVPAISRVIVKFAKTSYVPTQQIVNLRADGNVFLSPRLRAVGTQQTITTAGGTISHMGGSVTINPDTLTGVSGSDPIIVEFTSFNPTNAGEFKAFPGDFEGRLTTTGTPFAFETFGFVNVTIMQGTTKLTLNGTAELRIRVPAGLQARAASECPTIDLWYYNETLGYWILDGVATLEEPGHTYYRAVITHFSWWNCDQIYDTGYISGEVVTPNGEPFAGAYVKIIPVGWYGSAPNWDTITGADGKFTGLPIKAGATAMIYAMNNEVSSTPETIVGPSAGMTQGLPYPLVLVNSLSQVVTLTISPTQAATGLGKGVILNAKARNLIGTILSGKTITWESSNAGVATVDALGDSVSPTGMSYGTCIIYASCEGIIGQASLTVYPVASVEIFHSPAYTNVGSVEKLTATAKNSAGTVIPGRTFEWRSSNNGVATVQGSGTTVDATGVSLGTCTIYASSEGIEGSVQLSVVKPWIAVGNKGFSEGRSSPISIKVDNDIPYVAYADNMHSWKVTVMSYEAVSGTWMPVGYPGISAGQAVDPSLFVYNSIPNIAYQDWANSYKATCLSYEAVSGTWVPLGSPGFSDGNAYDESLFVYNGIPYVAYGDAVNGYYGATVMSYEAGTWVPVGNKGFTPGMANETSLYVSNGIPYVAYRDNAYGDKASVMKFNKALGTWEAVGGLGFSDGQVMFISLHMDNGIPYVAYVDYAHGNAPTVMSYEAGTWAPVGSPGFSGSYAYPSLFVYGGIPYVSYGDPVYNNKATVMKFNDALNTWEPVGRPGFSDGNAIGANLYVYNGVLYVTYEDDANGTKATVMKFEP